MKKTYRIDAEIGTLYYTEDKDKMKIKFAAYSLEYMHVAVWELLEEFDKNDEEWNIIDENIILQND